MLSNLVAAIYRLNPYCNGICSRRVANFGTCVIVTPVLILIVMEYVLGVCEKNGKFKSKQGLNPYCNGICSRRGSIIQPSSGNIVLILIVMEYVLGEPA